jgi:hypothetical protein
LSFDGLIRIEYGFHVTLIVGGALAAYFFLSVARATSRAARPASDDRRLSPGRKRLKQITPD